MHNEELHNLYSSPSMYNQSDQVKEVAMCRACSTNGEGGREGGIRMGYW
jgi:hypothetical protein